MDDTWLKYTELQKSFCKKLGVEFIPSGPDALIALSDSFHLKTIPIHGLRHPLEHTSGWFAWSEDYSEAADFFKPHHIKHLEQLKPEIIKYLGLPPGYRFLIDDKGYEDIWFDEKLLTI